MEKAAGDLYRKLQVCSGAARAAGYGGSTTSDLILNEATSLKKKRNSSSNSIAFLETTSPIGEIVMASENDIDVQVLGFNDAPTSDNTKTLSTGSGDCSPAIDVSVIGKTVMALENDDVDVQVLGSNDAPTSDNSKTLSTGSGDCSLAIGASPIGKIVMASENDDVDVQDWLRDAITDDVVAEEAEAYDHENDNDVVEYGFGDVCSYTFPMEENLDKMKDNLRLMRRVSLQYFAVFLISLGKHVVFAL